MLGAYLVKFRLMMREVAALKTGWDEPLPKELQVRWREMVRELVHMPEVFIKRCVQPQLAIGPPELVVYWDGSLVAYAATVYIRYGVEETTPGPWLKGVGKKNGFKASLLTSKIKLAPLGGITPPRSEMNGFVIAHRLAAVVITALRVKPSRVTFVGDSQCTIAAAEANSAALKPYMANRVAEVDDILSSIKSANPMMTVDPPFHTAGKINIMADMATRGLVTIQEVGDNSTWQQGLQYLEEERDCWPITRDFVREIPEEERRLKVYNMINTVVSKVNRGKEEPGVLGLVDRLKNVMNYSDSLDKVRGIMVRLLRLSSACTGVINRPTREDLKIIASKPITVAEYEKVDGILIVLSQGDIRSMMQKAASGRKEKVEKALASIQPYKKDGIWQTSGRFGKSLNKVLGPASLPILSPTSRLARLFIIASHQRNHMGGGDTLFRSRALAWIVRGRPQADKVSRDCRICIRKDKKQLEQQMGDLPEERTTFPSKPWSSTSIDLLGSYEVRAMNNQRSKKKCWPVVYCCMNTGALHVEVAHDYGTDAFICSYTAFVALRSRPGMVYTDRGSQLSRASQYLGAEDPTSWNWDKVTEVEAQRGTTWRFCPPGGQFRNGLAESRVKALKHTMDLLMSSGASSLNFNEFRCLLTRAADLINDRPLGVRHHRPGVEGELLPITPNLLILGRSSAAKPEVPLPLDESDDQYTRRAAFITELEEVWWSMWFAQVFDSLFPIPKWKVRMENLAAGDIVMVGWEAKLGKGQYRLARVKSVVTDLKGLVRTATVELRPRDSREKSLPYRSKDLMEMTVAIQRLVLICPAESVPSDTEVSVGSSD